MVIRRMDTRGQRLLTPAWDSITPACVWECTDVEGKPFIQRSPGPAGRQAGIRVNWGGMHSPGTSTHYMHEGCETPPARRHANTGAHHCALPGSIRHSAMMGGHLSPCVAGACLAGEARKAMALFSCKKLKNLPSVQWWRWGGLERGEMEGE